MRFASYHGVMSSSMALSRSDKVVRFSSHGLRAPTPMCRASAGFKLHGLMAKTSFCHLHFTSLSVRLGLSCGSSLSEAVVEISANKM